MVSLETNISFLLILAGVGLMIAEAMAPGAHLLVLGVALFGAGLIGFFAPQPFGDPLVLSALVLAIGAVSLYVYRQFDFYGGKGTPQTSDSGSLIGRKGEVTQRVTEQAGEVELYRGSFDPTFQARSSGEDIPVGTEIVVVDPGGGNVLIVEPVEE